MVPARTTARSSGCASRSATTSASARTTSPSTSETRRALAAGEPLDARDARDRVRTAGHPQHGHRHASDASRQRRQHRADQQPARRGSASRCPACVDEHGVHPMHVGDAAAAVRRAQPRLPQRRRAHRARRRRRRPAAGPAGGDGRPEHGGDADRRRRSGRCATTWSPRTATCCPSRSGCVSMSSLCVQARYAQPSCTLLHARRARGWHCRSEPDRHRPNRGVPMRAQPAHPRRTLRGPVALVSVAATLALVLAACGGGSGQRSEEARHIGRRRHAHLVDRPGRQTPRVCSRDWPRSSARPTPQRHDQRLVRRVDHRRPAAEAVGRLRQRHLPRHLLRLRQLGQRARRSRARPWTSPTQVSGPGGRLGRVPGGRARDGDRRTARSSASRRSSTTSALIYNTKLFDAAGVAYPTDRLDLGRLPRRGQGADRPGQERSTARRTRSPAARTPPGTCGRCCGRTAAKILDDDGRSRRSTPTPASTALETAARRWRSTTSRSTSTRPTRSTARCSTATTIGMMITGPWELYDLVKAQDAVRRRRSCPGTNGDHQTSPARTSGCCSTTRTPTGPTGLRASSSG